VQLDDHGVDRGRLRWALLKTLIKTLNVNLFDAYAFDLSAVCDPNPIMLARLSRRVCEQKKTSAAGAVFYRAGLDDVTAALTAKRDRRNRQHW